MPHHHEILSIYGRLGDDVLACKRPRNKMAGANDIYPSETGLIFIVNNVFEEKPG
jgi:hypothetical protein